MMRKTALLFSIVALTVLLQPRAVSAIMDVPPPSFAIFEEQVTPQETQALVTWKTEQPTKGQVEFAGVDGKWISTPWTQEYHTEHSFTLLDLQPGTRYTYRINAENFYGYGVREADVFTTQGTAVLAGSTAPAVLGSQQQVAQAPPTTQVQQQVTPSPTTSPITPGIVQGLLLVGGIILGVLLVILYRMLPHRLEVKITQRDKNPEQTTQPTADDTVEYKRALPEPQPQPQPQVYTPDIIEHNPTPNRFKLKLE